MPTMIQIRNVPEKVHRRLKIRAAMEGTSMSEYLLREVKKIIERPTRAELLERIAGYPELDLDPEPAAVLREERLRR